MEMGGAHVAVTDLSALERDGLYLEGTGALVLDRIHARAYVALSERAAPGALAAWEAALGWSDSVTFTATDADGRVVCVRATARARSWGDVWVSEGARAWACAVGTFVCVCGGGGGHAPVCGPRPSSFACSTVSTHIRLTVRGGRRYHTNIVLSIGTGFAVVCAESVAAPAERDRLLSALAASGREVVRITRGQMAASCGNVLELLDRRGLPVLACSARAAGAFTPEQLRVLRRHVAAVVSADVPVIERVGGGSVRCMIGEVFA